jgi:general secretion pathway protein J
LTGIAPLNRRHCTTAPNAGFVLAKILAITMVPMLLTASGVVAALHRKAATTVTALGWPTRSRRRSSAAGFTLIETLVAVTLMGVILAAIGSITAQWLPTWNRGFLRVQRSELVAVALNRLAADLAGAEFVTPNRDSRLPLFEGTPTAVTLVRSAIGPNTEPGLEVVRIAEATDRQGVVLLRTRSRFAPFGSGDVSASRLNFTDPVVLLRAPFRVSFSYSSGDGSWQDTWGNVGHLPAAVRYLITDTVTGLTLAISSATVVHVELPPGCADPTPDCASNSPGGSNLDAPANASAAAGGDALRRPGG